MYELWAVKNNLMYNVTPLIDSLSWKSNIDELGERLDFNVAFSDTNNLPLNPIDLGSLVILKNQSEIYRGIVFTEQRTGRDAISFSSFDYAVYLNKSKNVYQFKKVNAKTAIEKILKDYKIPIGKIISINATIKKIYPSDTGSDIIKDILRIATAQTGIKYRFEMRQGKFYVEKQQNLVIKGVFKLANNFNNDDVMGAISAPSRKRSIEDMKNSIIITIDDKIVINLKNNSLVSKYGLLQEVQSIDKKDKTKAKTIAQNLLNDLGKILEENSIEVPGDDSFRAGRIVEIQESVTGMKGKYLIKDVTHTVKNGIHTMSLGLGVI